MRPNRGMTTAEKLETSRRSKLLLWFWFSWSSRHFSNSSHRFSPWESKKLLGYVIKNSNVDFLASTFLAITFIKPPLWLLVRYLGPRFITLNTFALSMENGLSFNCHVPSIMALDSTDPKTWRKLILNFSSISPNLPMEQCKDIVVFARCQIEDTTK